MEIVFAAGTGTDVLFLGKGLSRIAVRGGEVEHFEIELPATFWPAEEWREEWMTTDVLVDGMVASAGDTAFLIRAAKRIAVLRSRCTAGRYSVWVGDSGGFESEDVILAGNDFESAGPEATVRLVHVERSAVVENRITNRGGVKHNYRIHGRSRLNWASRNDLVHSGIMLGTMDGDSIREQYFDDNVLWHTTPSLIEIHLDTPAVTMRGNTVHSDVWSCFLCRGTPAGWVIEDNTILPYEPPPVR